MADKKSRLELFLQDILNANTSEDVKRKMMDKFILQAPLVQSTMDCLIILKWSLELATNACTNFHKEIGLDLFVAWGQSHRDVLASLLTPALIQDLLTDHKKYPNLAVSLDFLNASLKFLNDSTTLMYVYKVIQNQCVTVLKADSTLSTAAALARLLKSYGECVPEKDGAIQLVVKLAEIIAAVDLPSDAASEEIMRDVVNISDLFGSMFSTFDNEASLYVLRVIFLMVAGSATVKEPSYVFGAIIQHVSLNLGPEVVSIMLSDHSISDYQIGIFVQWLIDMLQWRLGTAVIAKWVLNLLHGLAQASKFSLLITISQNKIEQIFHQLIYFDGENGILTLLAYILLSYQHSPDVFHKIVNHIPTAISLLQNKLQGEQKLELLTELAQIFHALMVLHSGFPELYDPVLISLKPYPKPSNERIKELLNENKWNQANFFPVLRTSCLSRSLTGKLGLLNLGNTCYMNCVLQALYMTDEFCLSVLKSHPHPNEKVLTKLQFLFAYLTHSQRIAINAAEFFQASRPSWFEVGHQQDCSEYLRYLLDSLHEQEQESHSAEEIGSSESQSASSKSPASPSALSLASGKSPTSTPTLSSLSKSLKRTNNGLRKECADAPDDCVGDSNFNTNASLLQSLIHKIFAGQLSTSYQCLKCGHVSEHVEQFIDLHLTFPRPQDAKEKAPESAGEVEMESGSSERNDDRDKDDKTKDSQHNHKEADDSKDNLQLNDLLRLYFTPETLEGENSYHCQTCGTLTVAERSTRIVKAPRHLILTLLRFSYDAQTHTHSKILKNVHYPLMLELPVCNNVHHASAKGSVNERRHSSTGPIQHDRFHLFAVIIHSGVSSESGHYYTYARAPSAIGDDEDCGDTNSKSDSLNNQWYNFNDNNVTYSTYKSFCTLTKRFPKDTAYILLYRRDSDNLAESTTMDSDPKLVILRKEVKDAVAEDHLSYLQEQEKEMQKAVRCRAPTKPPFFDDKNNPPGGCGGGGFSNNYPRFVC